MLCAAGESGPDGLPAVFRYRFSDPTDPTSLGNDRESMVGPGDSGGLLLVQENGQWRVAGVNTFTEGYGGRFGDTGGGVVLAPYLNWIYTTTKHPGAGSRHVDVDCGFLHVPAVACGLRGENRISRAV